MLGLRQGRASNARKNSLSDCMAGNNARTVCNCAQLWQHLELLIVRCNYLASKREHTFMKQHIVIVEDESALAANYRDLLVRQGYQVTLYDNAKDARQGLQAKSPDLAILDIALGDDAEAGFDLCRDLRSQNPTLPIVFLSARDTEVDVISGLRIGADDYLTKDISQPQLLARITALLRRVAALRAPENTEQILKRGDLELNTERLTVRWQGVPIDVTYTEFCMLHALARHPGHIKNRAQLMDAASVVLDDSTITSHIRRIRRKFEEHDKHFENIETAYGLGYRWKAES